MGELAQELSQLIRRRRRGVTSRRFRAGHWMAADALLPRWGLDTRHGGQLAAGTTQQQDGLFAVGLVPHQRRGAVEPDGHRGTGRSEPCGACLVSKQVQPCQMFLVGAHAGAHPWENLTEQVHQQIPGR